MSRHDQRHSHKLFKNGRTDQDAVWVVDLRGPRKHVLHGGADCRHLANTIELSICCGDAAFLSDYCHRLLLLYSERKKWFLLATGIISGRL